MEGEAHIQRGRLVNKGARLVYRGWDSSIEGKTRLRRGRLVYGGGDSSIEGKTRLRRGRLVYRGGDSSTEGERVRPAGRCNCDFQLSKCILRHHFLIFVLEMFISCARMDLPRSLVMSLSRLGARTVPCLSVITVSADLQIRQTFYTLWKNLLGSEDVIVFFRIFIRNTPLLIPEHFIRYLRSIFSLVLIGILFRLNERNYFRL